MMYWHIGERINREVLGNQRAEYGKQIVSTLLSKLSWSHFLTVMTLKDELQREFYLTMCSGNPAKKVHWDCYFVQKEVVSK